MKTKCVGIVIIFSIVWIAWLSSPSAPAAAEGKVSIALTHDLTSLNPFKARLGQDSNIYMALYQPLFTWNSQKGTSVPSLAESYKFAENHTDITVTLRKDAKFNNGDPVTARDVRFSWQQFIDPQNANAYARVFKSIKDIEVVDDYTCIIRLAKVNADWKGLFHRLFVASKNYYDRVGADEFTKKPIGSGPFRFVKRTIGESIILEAVPDHYMYPPNFKTLSFLMVPDEITRMAMLEKGEVDLIFSIPSQQVDRLKRNKKIKVKSAIVPSYYGLSFHTLNFDFLADKNFRLALNYGINRQEIVDKIFLGLAHPLHIFGTQSEITYDPNVNYSYDPEKSKALIKRSSYKPGTPLTLTYHSLVPNAAQVAEAVQGYLKNLGVTIELRQMEVGTYVALARKKSKDLGAISTTAWFGSQDPDVRLRMGVKSNGVYTQVPGRKDLDQLVDEQHVTIDEEQRNKTVNKIYQIMYADPPYVPLFGTPMIYATTDRIEYTWVNKVNRLFNLWEIKIIK
ncbi:MAG: ABC transporter substrate-binding protein [Planctomycetota bacterium]|jgi:peptide/nickel transport system substrate-binding protein